MGRLWWLGALAVWAGWWRRSEGAEVCPAPLCACLGTHVDCSRRRLTRIPHNLPQWTTILELEGNQIVNLSDSVLPHLPNLQKLDLSGNGVRELEASFFASFASVAHLDLRRNGLRRLPAELARLQNLSSLRLRENELEDVDAAVLGRMGKLEEVDLGKNRLRRWRRVEWVGGPAALRQLLLDGNRLESLDKDAFQGLPRLATLRLGRNRLGHLPHQAFRRLPALRTLDLARNRLRAVAGVAFAGLDSLVSLRLQRNAIEELEDGAFYGLASLNDLNLKANRIAELRKGWLYGLDSLTKLSLQDNQIPELSAGLWSYVPSLEVLDLSGNLLADLPQRAFAEAAELRELRLGQNQLRRLTNSSFEGAGSLSVLDLSGNRLKAALEDRACPLRAVRSLNELYLSNNSLRSLPDKAFASLTSLHVLDLSSNPISSLSAATFQGLKGLTQLKLNSSRLVCDCGVAWLEGWLSDSGLEVGEESLVCQLPTELSGRPLLGLAESALRCEDSPQPHVTEEPASVVGLAGGNATFRCAAAAHSALPLEVRWKRNGQVVHEEPASLEVRNEESEEGGLKEVVSELRLWDLGREEDAESEWQCLVRNEVGTAYSRKALLDVHVFPSFARAPADVRVELGKNARLECAVAGFPPPEISWQKDGGEGIPAAEQRRMHVSPSDDVFFIVQTRPEDAGTYTCTASSAAGVARASARLSLAPPSASQAHYGEEAGPPPPWDQPLPSPTDHAADPTPPVLVVFLVLGCILGTSLVWLAVLCVCQRRRKAPVHQPRLPTKAPATSPAANYHSQAPLLTPKTSAEVLNASWAGPVPPQPLAHDRPSVPRRGQQRPSQEWDWAGTSVYSSGESLRRNRRRVLKTESLRRMQSSALCSPVSADEAGLSHTLGAPPRTHWQREEPPRRGDGRRSPEPSPESEEEGGVPTASLDSGVMEEALSPAPLLHLPSHTFTADSFGPNLLPPPASTAPS